MSSRSAMTQSSRRTTFLAPLERSFTNEERARAVAWLFAEVAARKQQKAAIREWLGLSAGDSPLATTTTPAPLATAAVPNPAGPSSAISENPIVGLQTGARYGKACEILTILDDFKDFTATDPQNTVNNLQNTCQDMQTKLGFVLEYIKSINLNTMIFNILNKAGIRGPVWKKTMFEVENLMQQEIYSTNYLSQAYDAMSAIDGLMPEGY